MNDIHKANHAKVRYALSLLPERIADAVSDYHISNPYMLINEVRLRKGREITITADSANRRSGARKAGYITSAEDITLSVRGLCGGSVYAHSETIREGYINCGYGIRAGLCGHAVSESGRIVSVTDFASVNIRIPGEIAGAGCAADDILRNFGSIIVCSPPGEGKTTILRDLSVRLAGGVKYNAPLRVAVIDTRGELESHHGTTDERAELELDIFSGYPRSSGIDIAVRTMSPDVIVCDEISTADDIRAVLAASSSGVITASSVHAASFQELMRKREIKALWDSGAVAAAIFISRNKSGYRSIDMIKKAMDKVEYVCFSDDSYNYAVVFSSAVSEETVSAHIRKNERADVFEL